MQKESKIYFNVFFTFAVLLFTVSLPSCNDDLDYENTHHIDTFDYEPLKLEAQNAIPDSAIVIYNELKEIARKNNNIDELYYAYWKSAMVYKLSKDFFIESKDLLDSIKEILIINDRNDLLPSLNIRYGLIYHPDDSSLFFFNEALKYENSLKNEDKSFMYGGLSSYYSYAKNYQIAKKYTLLFLKENKNSQSYSKHKDQVAMLNNMYLIELGLKDTAAAIDFLRTAIQYSEDSLNGSGYAVLYANMGKYFLQNHKSDSARLFFNKFKKIIERDYEIDFGFYPQVYFAQTYLLDDDYNATKKSLQHAASYIDPLDLEDPVAQKEYFETLYQVEKVTGNMIAALEALENRNTYNQILHNRERDEEILKFEQQIAQAKSEKEIAEKEQKIEKQRTFSIFLIIALILSMIIGIITVLYWRNRKQLQQRKYVELEQKTELEKASILIKTEQRERRRIAKELHDEIGSTLTSIGLAVQVIKNDNIDSIQAPLEILDRNSYKLTQQANEIVWSLNDGNDNLKSLIGFINRHCNQFLSQTEIQYTFDNQIGDIPEIEIEGYKRRLLFQTIKEIVNNVVKHSQATELTFSIQIKDSAIQMNIQDNGVGFDKNILHTTAGNGLRNMKENITSISGSLDYEIQNGTLIMIRVPIKSLSVPA